MQWDWMAASYLTYWHWVGALPVIYPLLMSQWDWMAASYLTY
jgi:hypothetical protein